MKSWLIGVGMAAIGFFGMLLTIAVGSVISNDLHKITVSFLALSIVGMFVIVGSSLVMAWKDMT